MAKNWAICIGINHYENLQPLCYAVNDADALRHWLISKVGFSEKRVYYFADNSPPIADANKPFDSQPTFGKLMRFLNVRFKAPFLESGDNLWFFFSGHGIRYQEQDYLMLSDSDSDGENITRTAIPLNYITECLRKSGADNVMVFVDACRESTGKKGLGSQIKKQQGIIKIASCSPNELSYEIEELSHGAFTYALLESLEIQGESNCATLERLAKRLEYRVNEINREYRKPRQTPYAVAEPASKYHLILLPDYIKPTLDDIATLREDALEAEAEGNLKLAKSLWTRLVQVDPDRALKALERIWSEQKGIPKSNNQLELDRAGSKSSEIYPPRAKTARPRANNPQNRSTNQNRRSNPTPQTNFTRRRLLQIAGWTGTGVGTVFVTGKGLEWIFDRKNETEVKQKNDEIKQNISNLKQQIPEFQPKVELVKSEPFDIITVDVKGEEVKRESLQVEYFTEDLGNNFSLEMVAIPGGEFLMGTEDEEIERLNQKYKVDLFNGEKPQHKVTIQPFYMGKYQVTQAQWQAVMGNNPSRFKDDPQNPVERVSWNGAQEFCKKLSAKTGKKYRLPSEAEWEYACRAGTTTPFHFGETMTGELANYVANKTFGEEAPRKFRGKTTPVGSFLPNAFGLNDMHGNVWEWCEDGWHKDYGEAPVDGSAWLTNKDIKKIVRGGTCVHISGFCRSAYRSLGFPDDGSIIYGFRLAVSDPRTL